MYWRHDKNGKENKKKEKKRNIYAKIRNKMPGEKIINISKKSHKSKMPAEKIVNTSKKYH